MKIYVKETNEVINLDHVVRAKFDPNETVYRFNDGYIQRSVSTRDMETRDYIEVKGELVLEGHQFSGEFNPTITRIYGEAALRVWTVIINDAWTIE